MTTTFRIQERIGYEGVKNYQVQQLRRLFLIFPYWDGGYRYHSTGFHNKACWDITSLEEAEEVLRMRIKDTLAHRVSEVKRTVKEETI